MKPIDRRKEIIALLRAVQTELRVDDLAQVLKVSPLTIRQDLTKLAQHSIIIRTHGGCIAAGRAALETEYHQKVAHNFDLKQAIGRTASAEVNAGDILLINDGSTTYHLAAHLERKGPLTVYTNSLAMITDLNRCKNLTLYILGGRYNSEMYSIQGSLTEQLLERLHFDLCFLGADAVTVEGQCMVTTPEEASMTRSMLRRAKRRILLADHTKVGSLGYSTYGSLRDFDLWITTRGLRAESFEVLSKLVTIKEAD